MNKLRDLICVCSGLVERNSMDYGRPDQFQFLSDLASALGPRPHESAWRQNTFKQKQELIQ
jgi:hypothetical protein